MAQSGVDRILQTFLLRQCEVAARLSAASAIVKVRPAAIRGVVDVVPQHFLAEFSCRGLVKLEDGQIAEADQFAVGIFFPLHYLRRANVFESLSWLWPMNVYHPNISKNTVCIGEQFMRPGTGLEEIIYQLFSVVTYARWSSHAALNEEAAQWARANQHRFPIDRRPLKGRVLDVQVEQRGKDREVSCGDV